MDNLNPNRLRPLSSDANRTPDTSAAPTEYSIVVGGFLDDGWSSWLGGLELRHDQEGNTQLIGTIPDQAALFGILLQVRDLGLPLVSLQQLGGS